LSVGGSLSLSPTAVGVFHNVTAAATITLNTGTAFNIGQSCDFLRTGAGAVSFSAGAGITLYSTPATSLRAVGSAATLMCIAPNAYALMGDLG
jgi:hypothetical protein